MALKPRITDAEFEVVSGPYRVGDENRVKRGWFLTDRVGKRGEPLWYRPPGKVSKWIRRIGIAAYVGCIALGFIAMVLGEIFAPRS